MVNVPPSQHRITGVDAEIEQNPMHLIPVVDDHGKRFLQRGGECEGLWECVHATFSLLHPHMRWISTCSNFTLAFAGKRQQLAHQPRPAPMASSSHRSPSQPSLRDHFLVDVGEITENDAEDIAVVERCRLQGADALHFLRMEKLPFELQPSDIAEITMPLSTVCCARP